MLLTPVTLSTQSLPPPSRPTEVSSISALAQRTIPTSSLRFSESDPIYCLHQAINYNDPSCVEAILTQSIVESEHNWTARSLSEYDWISFLMMAAARGYKSIVSVFLRIKAGTDKARAALILAILHQNSLEPSPEIVIKEVLFNISDCRAFVEEFIALKKLEYLENLLLNAAFYGQLQLVEVLFEKKIVSSCSIGYAFSYGSIHSSLEMVQAFIRQDAITQIDRGHAIIRAAAYGYEKIVQLISLGSINPLDQERAICAAAKGGYLEIVKVLFSKTIAPISASGFGDAVQLCVKYNHLKVLEFLLTQQSMDEVNRQVAIQDAVYYHHLDILKKLLEGLVISQKDLDDMVQWATLHGDLDVVTFYLQKGTISEEALDKAIVHATKRHYLPLLISLFDYKQARGFKILQTLLEKLVLIAALKGHADTLEFLLKQGPISKSLQEKGIFDLKNHLDSLRCDSIVKLLEAAVVS